MNNLEGFISKDTGTIHINVCNVQAFRDLVQQAQKEADALQKTMRRLESFTLDIKFEEN